MTLTSYSTAKIKNADNVFVAVHTMSENCIKRSGQSKVAILKPLPSHKPSHRGRKYPRSVSVEQAKVVSKRHVDELTLHHWWLLSAHIDKFCA